MLPKSSAAKTFNFSEIVGTHLVSFFFRFSFSEFFSDVCNTWRMRVTAAGANFRTNFALISWR